MRRNLRLDWRALALLGALLSIIIDWSGLVYAMPITLPTAMESSSYIYRKNKGSIATVTAFIYPYQQHHHYQLYNNFDGNKLKNSNNRWVPINISNLIQTYKNYVHVQEEAVHQKQEQGKKVKKKGNFFDILSRTQRSITSSSFISAFISTSSQQFRRAVPPISSHQLLTDDSNRNSAIVVRHSSNNTNKSKRLNNNKNNLDRNERSTLSHLSGPSRKIQLYIKNRFIQLMPDGTVNGTQDEQSEYTILQRSSLDVGRIKIQGVATCLYLCMDPCGTVYGSKEFNDDCVFNENMELHNYNTYSSTYNSNARRKYYLALNRHGEPRRLQIPPTRSLGKLATYTNAITETVPQERVEQLIAKNFGANRIKHGIRQLCDTGKPLIQLIDGKHFKARPKCNLSNINNTNDSSSVANNSSKSHTNSNDASNSNSNSNSTSESKNNNMLHDRRHSNNSNMHSISTLTNTSYNEHLTNTSTNVPAVVNKNNNSNYSKNIIDSNNNNNNSRNSSNSSSSSSSNSSQISFIHSETSGHISDSVIFGKMGSHLQQIGSGWKKKKKKRKCHNIENDKDNVHNDCLQAVPQALRKKSQVLGPKRAQKCRDLFKQQQLQKQQYQEHFQEIVLPPMCEKLVTSLKLSTNGGGGNGGKNNTQRKASQNNHKSRKSNKSGHRHNIKHTLMAAKKSDGSRRENSQNKKRRGQKEMSNSTIIMSSTRGHQHLEKSRTKITNRSNSTNPSKSDHQKHTTSLITTTTTLFNTNFNDSISKINRANSTSDRGDREERNVHFPNSMEDWGEEELPLNNSSENVRDNNNNNNIANDDNTNEINDYNGSSKAKQDDLNDDISYEDDGDTEEINNNNQPSEMVSETPFVVNGASDVIYYDQLDL